MTNSVPYPYALGQTKGGDTSLSAQKIAMNNENNTKLRTDCLFALKEHGALSPEEIMEKIPQWRARYPDNTAFLQDVRRKCSELIKANEVKDSGLRDEKHGSYKLMVHDGHYDLFSKLEKANREKTMKEEMNRAIMISRKEARKSAALLCWIRENYGQLAMDKARKECKYDDK